MIRGGRGNQREGVEEGNKRKRGGGEEKGMRRGGEEGKGGRGDHILSSDDVEPPIMGTQKRGGNLSA